MYTFMFVNLLIVNVGKLTICNKWILVIKNHPMVITSDLMSHDIPCTYI